MKRKFAFFSRMPALALCFGLWLLCGFACGRRTPQLLRPLEPVPSKQSFVPTQLPLWEQTVSHLHLPEQEHTATDKPILATWLPYFLYDALLEEADEGIARAKLRAFLEEAKALGINTIFAHVCAFGESYYPSTLYVQSSNCKVDLLQWLCAECAALNLSLHAWINPLRLQTDDVLSTWRSDTQLGAWYHNSETVGRYLVTVGSRWYLNPAYPAVRTFLCDAVKELLTQYPIDGIHIDDYFYPTTDPAFDAEAFAASGASDRAAWRTEQIHSLVSALYQAVHTAKADAIFSVSPQGNLTVNRTTQYADPAKWCATEGYCDWLIPQLYYGYENETLPFPKALSQWQSLPRCASVSLLIGLATYKVGSVDGYAGSGQTEWQTASGIPAKEATDVLQDPSLAGIALYHLQTTLQLPPDEQEALRCSLSAVIPNVIPLTAPTS